MRARFVLASIFLIAILAASTLPVPVSAAPTPLYVYVKEYVNATVETDGVGVRCGTWNVTGYIIVKNNNSGEPVYDIWLPLNHSSTVTINLDSKPDYATVVNEQPPDWVINTYPSGYGTASNLDWWHITELHSGDQVVFKYTKDGWSECPPIRVNETYIPAKIVDGVSSTVKVNLTIINDFTDNAQVKVKKVLPADRTANDGWSNSVSGNPIFTNAGTPGAGSSSYSSDQKELYWTGDGTWPDGYFTVPAGGSVMLKNFQVQGTPDLSEVGGTTKKIGMGQVYVYFTIGRSLTNTTVGYVYAIGQSGLEVQKEQDTSSPTTWHETLVVYDTSGIFDYEVVNTTVWATEGNTPDSSTISGSRNSQQQGAAIATIGPGESSTSYTYGDFTFTYNLVPKIWGLFKARIQRDDTHGWMNYTNTTMFEERDGTKYNVTEKIWVVNGYLVKARKEVRPGSSSGEVCIGITLDNLGGSMTPYVEFYDLVPVGFDPYPSSTEGNMKFYPLSMLAVDANPSSPPDYSLITSPTGYNKGYVWKSYPLPGPQAGFVEWFPDTSTSKSITVTLADGTTRPWTVQVSGTGTITINGTSYSELSEFTVDPGTAAETTFNVTLVDDSIASGGGGYVVVSAKGYYSNMDVNVYNPVFVHYCLQGSGDYNLTDVFVVGVDPRNTLDANAVFMPFAGISLSVLNLEPWFLVALACLVIAEVWIELRSRSNKKAGMRSPLMSA